MAIAMAVYSADALKALNVSQRTPPRAVRKTLFSLRLWRPVCDRCLHLADSVNNVPMASQAPRRSADPLMVIGWLNCQSIRNKMTAVHSTITERSLDVLALSETWHDNSSDVSTTMHARWLRGRRCRTDNWSWWRCRYRLPTTSQVLAAVTAPMSHARGRRRSTRHRQWPVVIVNIYRPGSERPSAAFFEELTGLLELLVQYSCPVVVGGDLSVHVNDADSTDARQLTSLLSSFDMVQHVCSTTHRAGNVLDLVITFSDRAPADVTVDPHSVISDHALVRCSLPVTVDAPPLTERLVRGWRRVS